MQRFSQFDNFRSAGGTRYRLASAVEWEIGRKGSGWVLQLPGGYTFDISVPRGLRWLLSPHNRRVLLAAAVHDRLLEEGHDPSFASAEFRRAAMARGVGRVFAWGLFAATWIWTVLISGGKGR